LSYPDTHHSKLPAILSHGLSDTTVGQGKVIPTILVVDQAHDRRQEAVGALQLVREWMGGRFECLFGVPFYYVKWYFGGVGMGPTKGLSIKVQSMCP